MREATEPITPRMEPEEAPDARAAWCSSPHYQGPIGGPAQRRAQPSTADSALARSRNSKCTISQPPPSSSSAQPWTIHSLLFFIPGPRREDMQSALRALTPAPLVFDKKWTDRESGKIITLSHRLRLDFARPEDAALLPLSAVADALGPLPWASYPGLRVSRLDLASDHLVSGSPRAVCDGIAGLHLPYSRAYRGPEDADEVWPTSYHNGGKARAPRVVVVHYPRLEALLLRHPDASAAARRYTEHRVRQEVRLRGPGLRTRLGGGSMTAEAVLGSFPAFVEFALRRLRPVFEAGILSPPPRDLAGEAALASVANLTPYHDSSN